MSATLPSSRVPNSSIGSRATPTTTIITRSWCPPGITKRTLWASGVGDTRRRLFAGLVSFQPHLCEQGRAPKQKTTPEFAAVANYAYHFDAVKTGSFLRRHCVEHLGVEHVVDHVLGVNSAGNGDIESLQTRDHGRLKGDLFIDCTGFSALLLGQHYGIPFIGRRDVLFNDTALVAQAPYAHEKSPIVSHTVSTARAAGWIWDIGLSTRRGIGYVYSSAHASDGEAEKTLLDYVRQLPDAAPDEMGPTRKNPDQSGTPGDVLAQELRGGGHIRRVHRAARSIGAGADRDVRGDAARRPALNPRRHGHRRSQVQ